MGRAACGCIWLSGRGGLCFHDFHGNRDSQLIGKAIEEYNTKRAKIVPLETFGQMAHLVDGELFWQNGREKQAKSLKSLKLKLPHYAAISIGFGFIIAHNLRDFDGVEAYGIRAVTPNHFLGILCTS